MTLLALVESTTRDYLERRGDPARLDDPGFQSSMTLFKVSASELATKTVLDAFFASGIAGYRNNGEFSISRQLRDILSSMVMINNQRILTNAGPSCLIGGVPEYLMGDR